MKTSRKQNGFTMKRLIGTIVIGVTLIPLVGCFNHSEAAETSMDSYVNKLYPGSEPRSSCAGVDTDDDGYVRCTAVYTGKNGADAPIVAECAIGYFTFNSGCVPPKIKIR